MGHVMWPHPFQESLSSIGWDLLWSTCTQNLKSLCPPNMEIWNTRTHIHFTALCILSGITQVSR